MRQEVVIVLITNRIYLYGIPEFAIIGQIDTTQGSRPTIGLSQAENNFVLALPGVDIGTIVLKTSLDSGVVEENFLAHEEKRVDNIVVSHDGSYLASMTANGKRIKIFSVATKELLKELRRGFTEKASSQMLFSREN